MPFSDSIVNDDKNLFANSSFMKSGNRKSEKMKTNAVIHCTQETGNYGVMRSKVIALLKFNCGADQGPDAVSRMTQTGSGCAPR